MTDISAKYVKYIKTEIKVISNNKSFTWWMCYL